MIGIIPTLTFFQQKRAEKGFSLLNLKKNKKGKKK